MLKLRQLVGLLEAFRLNVNFPLVYAKNILF